MKFYRIVQVVCLLGTIDLLTGKSRNVKTESHGIKRTREQAG